MPCLESSPPRASAAQRAIRASRALRARRDYGLVAGDHASYWQWAAWERKAGPVRRGLEPLSAVDAVLWRAVFELAPTEER
jgi:hypothetical protein